MTTIARRLLFSFFLFAAVAATPATPAYAGRQPGPQRMAEGSHAWGADGWCYVLQSGRWVRMNYFRRFVYQNNVHIFDLFQNGQFLKRVDVSRPGWIKELTAANNAASSLTSWYMYPINQNLTEANVYFLVKASNQWWSLTQLRAAAAQQRSAAVYAGNPASILGGTGSSLPSVGNPASILGGYSRSDAQVLIAAQTGSVGRSVWVEPNCNASYNGCR